MNSATRLLSYSAAYGATVAMLHLVDGPWKRWPKGQLIDNWTYTHIAWGVLAKIWGLSLEQITALTVINELGEAWVRKNRPNLLFGSPESAPNIGMDISTTLVAFRLMPPYK